MERHNQRTTNTDWAAYTLGCIAGIVPWITIGIALAGSYTLGNSSPPDFVIGIFLFFNCFAINM